MKHRTEIILPILMMCSNVLAQSAGQLDTTFADSGYVITNGSVELQHARSLVQTSDGRVIVVGTALGQGTDIGVASFLNNGEADIQFSNDGSTSIHLDWTDFGESCALQNDGNIVIAGMTYIQAMPTIYKGCLARMNGYGDLDPTYGNGGSYTIDLTDGMTSFVDVAIQPDGRIVACGGMVVHRTTADGIPDQSFGTDGTVLIPNATAWSITVEPDMAGMIVAGSGISRLLMNGELDSLGFGVNGWAVLPDDLAGSNYFKDVLLQPDGRILVTGYTTNTDSVYIDSLILLRLLPNGTPDTTFAQDGSLKLGSSGGLALAVQPDGMIVVTGSIRDSLGDWRILLARFDPSGTLDPSFGDNGLVVFTPSVPGPHVEMGTGIVIGSDATITICAGFWGNEGLNGFLVARFLGNTLPTVIQNPNRKIFRVYPVPAIDEINVECPGCEGQLAVLEVLDAIGRSIHSQHLIIDATMPAKISTRWIPSGVYHLRISCGSKVYSHPVIVQ